MWKTKRWFWIMVCLCLPGWLDAEALRVTTTTTHVADLVREVGGPAVEVESLMGPGVDPHLYKPSAPDIGKLRRADVIFYSGLKLEGHMGELFERMRERGARVVAVTDAIPRERLLDSADYVGHYDPHVWFDPTLWSYAAEAVAEELSRALPEEKAAFSARAEMYQSRLRELDAWTQEQLETIPLKRRLLVTSHDAFNYFGNRYGIEVVAVQGISTAVEAGLADIAAMVDLVKERDVPAIFVESSVSPAAMRRISEDAGVKIGGELFSDSLGAIGEVRTLPNGERVNLGTLEGTIQFNVLTVVDALKGEG